ncbi:MAG: FGGY family carbohydrate kinase [Actinomycetaceae bacterium]|nr:FGGY family carbohydrate kinase [Actinomycetaceae bacterium]
MSNECVIGVDVGTSSTKGVLTTIDGTVLATTIRNHKVDNPRPGHFEMDGNIWWEEFQSIAQELLAHAPGKVSAIGLSGMGPCVFITDAHFTPLAPAILYGIDTRAQSQIDTLNSQLGATDIFQSTDSYLSSQAAGPKLRWFLDNHPQHHNASIRLFMPASWLAYQLTGSYTLDRQSASQCTPLYDPHTQQWNKKTIDHACPQLTTPELYWSGEIVGYTTNNTCLPAGIPVIAGTIDAWAEGYSVDALQPGHLFLMYGTTMFMIATSNHRLRHPSMWGTTCVRENQWNLAGGMATSGAITTWLKDLVHNTSYEELSQQAATISAGSKGLLLLPYFAGERTPIQDPLARGVLAGLTLTHGAGHIYRSILESTGFAIRHNIESFSEAGATLDTINAAGGGTQSDVWLQIVSDITGCEQLIRQYSIGAAFGDCRLAAQAIGAEASIDKWNPVSRAITPNTIPVYDELYEMYRELYTATKDIQHRLAHIESNAQPERR